MLVTAEEHSTKIPPCASVLGGTTPKPDSDVRDSEEMELREEVEPRRENQVHLVPPCSDSPHLTTRPVSSTTFYQWLIEMMFNFPSALKLRDFARK